MRIIVADWETYFCKKSGYTLSSMTTEAYIRDKRFEPHGVAIKDLGNPPHPKPICHWLRPDEFRQWAASIDWSDVFLIHHHAQFDGLIETHHFGVNPRAFGCTLAMARLLLGNHHSVSLDSVRKHFGMPAKSTPYGLFDGKHWNELDLATQEKIATGACDEVESIWKIFSLLARDFPKEEYQVVDTTIRMFTCPMLRGDIDLLADIWEAEEKKKGDGLQELGFDISTPANRAAAEKELQSNEKFATLLRACGVEPWLKDGKNGPIYAFAKTDDFMREFCADHPDQRVQTLAATRLGVKSTYMQTRAQTWAEMAQRGPMCVYLNYAGAGTLRPSGGDSSNFLNMKRQSPIRKSLLAPEGWLLFPADLSQIECRVLHYLAGGPEEPVIIKFRNHEDPYIDLASLFYNEKVYKPKKGDPRFDEMEAKRGMGKQGRLMCGYGASGMQFKITAKNGLYGPPVDIPIEEADRFVYQIYRPQNPSITAKHSGYWAQCDRMIARLAGGPPCDWGPLHVREGRIYLPNGCPLIYDTMEFHRPDEAEKEKLNPYKWDGFWRVRTRHGWKEMWGSKLTQNICEAVSRVVATQAMNRLTAMGYRVLNYPYDELLIPIRKDGNEQKHAEIIIREMERPVEWLPGLPLQAEGVLGERYSK